MKRALQGAGAGLLLLLGASAASATNVSLVGVIGGKALVSVDRGAPQVMAPGSTSGSVQVESVSADRAVFVIDGKRETILLGQFYGGTANGGRQTATLIDDGRGSFVAMGLINGRTVRFVADTGATLVVISSSEADRLGLAWRAGPTSLAQTANGNVEFHQIKIPSIKVGEIVLNDVACAVQEQGLASGMALLGQSFLSRTDMTRTGTTMELTKRF